MRPLGKKKISTRVAGHQDCEVCHPEVKNGRARESRYEVEEIARQILDDDGDPMTPEVEWDEDIVIFGLRVGDEVQFPLCQQEDVPVKCSDCKGAKYLIDCHGDDISCHRCDGGGFEIEQAPKTMTMTGEVAGMYVGKHDSYVNVNYCTETHMLTRRCRFSELLKVEKDG